jgi:hypothetical protein
VRIELTHKGFADLSLTTWVPRLNLTIITGLRDVCQRSQRSFYRIDDESVNPGEDSNVDFIFSPALRFALRAKSARILRAAWD